MDNSIPVQPKYVGLKEAVERYFRYYINPYGRSTRSEYWYAIIFTAIITGIAGAFSSEYVSSFAAALFFVPNICITVRRLHDTGKSWVWIFIQFVPIIGTIWYLILMIRNSEGYNEYGPSVFERQFPEHSRI